MKLYIFLFIIALETKLFLFPASAQQLNFTNISDPESTIAGFFTGITQDRQGYIWASSQGGLHRFDGYKWISYMNDPTDTNSLSSNWVECVYADREGYIWAGTYAGKGLDRLDLVTGKFTHFQPDPTDSAGKTANYVTVITEDRQGNLWVGTHGGLTNFNRKTGTFTRFRHNPVDSTSLSHDQVRVIYQDRQGTLWVGTGDQAFVTAEEGGLNRFDDKNRTFTRFQHKSNNPHSLIDNRVRAIYEDSRGTFWVGTYGDGLHTMDRKRGTFQRHTYDPKQPGKLTRPYRNHSLQWPDGVNFIHEDATGNLWIGTRLNGVNSYNLQTGQVTLYPINNKSIEFDNGWWAFTSREGVLWISAFSTNGVAGLYRGGLYRADPFVQSIPYYRMGSQVRTFYEETPDIVWIGTTNGLFRKDRKQGSVTHFFHNSNKTSSPGDNWINIIYKDHQGRLWIGVKGILYFFDPQTQTFTTYGDKIAQTVGSGANPFFSVYQDQQDNLWIGSQKGLYWKDLKTGRDKLYKPASADEAPQNIVICLLHDQKGRLWVGTWAGGGLKLLDRDSGKFLPYLNGTNVTSLYEDSGGTLWVGTETFLFYKNTDSDNFSLFAETATGRKITSINGIVEDNAKNLWVSSLAGLVRISPQRNTIRVFGKNYGVDGISLYARSIYKGTSGKIFIGDQSGYYSFAPTTINGNAHPPQIAFTDLRLFDQSVLPGNGSPLRKPLDQIKELRLHHHQNVFSFHFAAIHYSQPEQNRHLYKLDRYDNTWRTAGSEQSAYYNKIPPGEYIFRVKAASSEGVWAEKSISIIILPPWWQTWWAYVLYAFVLVGSIWGVAEYRSHTLKSENRLLEQKIKERTVEVVDQKVKIELQRDNLEKTLSNLQATQIQLIQQEKMASLGELTAGIAHEIQNPLNFVNNFSEVSQELCEEIEQEAKNGHIVEVLTITADLKQNLEKIHNHGKRADSIVKNMLQHSRSSSGEKQLTDINALVEEYLRLAYHGLRAKEKDFHAEFKLEAGPALGKIEVVPQEIGRVLLNLFNNAFYATNQKKAQLNGQYQPQVIVSTKAVGDKLEIRVRDNGIGIPDSVQHKIFQPFFTTKPTGEGTGLGLSLSYDIITKGHGGELVMDSKEGEYTAMIIRLPLQA